MTENCTEYDGITFAIFGYFAVVDSMKLICLRRKGNHPIEPFISIVFKGVEARTVMFLAIDDFFILHEKWIWEINEILIVDKIKMSVIHEYLRKKPHPVKDGANI